jgi:hypothetical protein
VTDNPTSAWADQPTDIRSRLAAIAGADPATEAADLAADILRRARWAAAHNDGHPNGAWSTGEQLAVAFVLDDREHLAAMDYTPEQAARRVADGMYFPPADFTGWLNGIRDRLGAES